MKITDTIEEQGGLVVLLLKVLKKKWGLFLLLGVVFAALGFFYATLKQPVYESRLTFALDDGGGESGVSDAISLASQFGINIGGSGGNHVFGSDNIIEIMVSRRVVERTLLSVDTFDNKPYTLIGYYLDKITGKKKVDKINFPVGFDKTSLTYSQDSVLYLVYQDFIKNKIVADRPDKKLNIYQVKVTSPDEKFTKVFTDKLVAETNAFYTEICSKKAKETLVLLEQRVESMKGNLSSSITEKALSQDANINPALTVIQAPIQQQQADIQVYGAAYTELFKSLEMARYQYLKGIPLMQIIDAADYPMRKVVVSKFITALIFVFLSEMLLLSGFVFYLFIKQQNKQQ
jgi:hypothetical protein